MKYLLAIILLSPIVLNAKHLHKEKYYQNIFCNKIHGIKEYTLQDKTRIDCLTKTYAIEVDFANKWAESIGQSLYYGLMSNKRPGVLLIMEKPKKDIRYLRRLKKISEIQNIRIWTIDKDLVIQAR